MVFWITHRHPRTSFQSFFSFLKSVVYPSNKIPIFVQNSLCTATIKTKSSPHDILHTYLYGIACILHKVVVLSFIHENPFNTLYIFINRSLTIQIRNLFFHPDTMKIGITLTFTHSKSGSVQIFHYAIEEFDHILIIKCQGTNLLFTIVSKKGSQLQWFSEEHQKSNGLNHVATIKVWPPTILSHFLRTTMDVNVIAFSVTVICFRESTLALYSSWRYLLILFIDIVIMQLLLKRLKERW